MTSQDSGRSNGVLIGCLVAVACLLAVASLVAVYRYRRCYDGTYEIDAESSANGYVPTTSMTVGNGELRPMCKLNGSARTKPGANDGHTVARPSKELYV